MTSDLRVRKSVAAAGLSASLTLAELPSPQPHERDNTMNTRKKLSHVCSTVCGRSIDSMIRRLTKRTELEIVAQWPNEGDIADDAATAYLTSLLEDCSPDANSGGKLSTRAPEQLMCLLVTVSLAVITNFM